jgi:hypothetical protein
MASHIIFDKMANNIPLSETEKRNLERFAIQSDKSNSVIDFWLQNGSTSPNFGEIRATTGLFDVAPLDALSMQFESSLSVPHNTETSIPWETTTIGTRILSLDEDNPDRIKVHYEGRTLGVIGSTEWANNGAGRRAIHLNAYNKDDTLLYGYTLHSMKPTGVDIDTLPFASFIKINKVKKVSYFKITVIQTSGGSLSLGFARIGFFTVI